MIDALRIIAERRISEAIQSGKLHIENWKNKPLPVEDGTLVPEDLRMAYKVLKNAGYLPPEIETRKEISHLEELIAQTDDEHIKLKQLKKLDVLVFKLNSMRQVPSNIDDQEKYYGKVVEKISLKK